MLSGKDYNHHGFLNKPWLFSFNMPVVDAIHNTEKIVAGGVVAPFCGLEYDVQAIALNNHAFWIRDKSQLPQMIEMLSTESVLEVINMYN